jgi:hypothetical protein
MADQSDRKIIPDLLQTGLTISLGAAHKSLEMMRSPDAISEMISEMKSVFTLPFGTGEGLQDKAQAMASVWVTKGVTLMAECKVAGEKLSEEK